MKRLFWYVLLAVGLWLLASAGILCLLGEEVTFAGVVIVGLVLGFVVLAGFGRAIPQMAELELKEASLRTFPGSPYYTPPPPRPDPPAQAQRPWTAQAEDPEEAARALRR